MHAGDRDETLLEADVERICHALASYGVLTHEGLAGQVHAHEWEQGRFQAALERGVADGRVVQVGEGFYELGETGLGT